MVRVHPRPAAGRCEGHLLDDERDEDRPGPPFPPRELAPPHLEAWARIGSSSDISCGSSTFPPPGGVRERCRRPGIRLGSRDPYTYDGVPIVEAQGSATSRMTEPGARRMASSFAAAARSTSGKRCSRRAPSASARSTHIGCSGATGCSDRSIFSSARDRRLGRFVDRYITPSVSVSRYGTTPCMPSHKSGWPVHHRQTIRTATLSRSLPRRPPRLPSSTRGG